MFFLSLHNVFILEIHKKTMAKDKGVSMASSFGGLTRFSDEYGSKFNLKPTHVIAFIILLIAFRIFLGIFYGAQ